MIFFTGNPYLKHVFDQNCFYLSIDFQNFSCTICDKLHSQVCQKVFSTISKIYAKKHYHKLGNTVKIQTVGIPLKSVTVVMINHT